MIWTFLAPALARWSLLAALCAAIGGASYLLGLKHEQALWAAADALRDQQDNAHLLADTERVRRQEASLNHRLALDAEQRYQENQAHEQELDKLRAAVRAGTERLRCPAATLPADAPAHDPGASIGSGEQARSGELVPATSDDLFRIGGRIAGIVRERNALIDAYQAARSTCNGDSQ